MGLWCFSIKHIDAKLPEREGIYNHNCKFLWWQTAPIQEYLHKHYCTYNKIHPKSCTRQWLTPLEMKKNETWETANGLHTANNSQWRCPTTSNLSPVFSPHFLSIADPENKTSWFSKCCNGKKTVVKFGVKLWWSQCVFIP